MGGSKALAAAGLVCFVLLGRTPARADEPFWNSRPLSHWVAVLQSGDPAARIEAARGLTEIALTRGALPSWWRCLTSSTRFARTPLLREAATTALQQVGPSAGAAVRRCSSCSNRIPMPKSARTPGWRSRKSPLAIPSWSPPAAECWGVMPRRTCAGPRRLRS